MLEFLPTENIVIFTPAPAEHGLNPKVTDTLLVLLIVPSKGAVQKLTPILCILLSNLGERQGHITPDISSVKTAMNKTISIIYYGYCLLTLVKVPTVLDVV